MVKKLSGAYMFEFEALSIRPRFCRWWQLRTSANLNAPELELKVRCWRRPLARSISSFPLFLKFQAFLF